MRQIVLATNNAGKTREIENLLQDLPIKIIPQGQLNVDEIEETAITFIENALAKARNACSCTGLAALADDSGLVVSALNGKPGIYSARFAGEKATDKENIKKLLQDLSDIAPQDRRAYFHCTLIFMENDADPAPMIYQGQWDGHILLEPTGTQGFGYDPIFFVEEYKCSAAELPLSLKNQISHRGQALAQLKKNWVLKTP